MAVMLCGALGGARVANAQQQQPQQGPERYFGALSTGDGLRLTRNTDYGQGTFVPAFIDALAAYVLPGARLRHGVGLGASVNYTDDGGYIEPVIAFEQLVLMPTYLVYADLNRDFLLLGHVGVPITVAGGPNAGFELAAAGGYRMLAGFGLLAELGLTTFVGTATSLHPAVTLELGVFLDYEVLP